jgi:hypothetical protein
LATTQEQTLTRVFGSSDPKIVSVVATWIGIVLVGLMIHQLALNRTRLRRHHRPAADLMHPI